MVGDLVNEKVHEGPNRIWAMDIKGGCSISQIPGESI